MLLKDQEQNIKYRWVYGFIPAILLLIFVFLTLSFFTSNYYVMSPRLTMDEWSCSGKPGDERAWGKTYQALETARKLDPWNADIYLDMGRLYEWKALSGSAWNTSTKDARKQASHYFKQAAIHRPTWALAWTSYAQSQLINRVVDDEVFYAISNGFEYGRWQIKTQKKLLWLSIGIWDKLPKDVQRQVREQVQYILERDDGVKLLTPSSRSKIYCTCSRTCR